VKEAVILNIETSAIDCSVSLAKNGELVAFKKSEADWRHSKEISILIDNILNESNHRFNMLSAVAVSEGPGSYTGLRVGSSAAKAICYALKIPLLGIETLKIIAFPYLNKVIDDGLIIPVIDARRDEVYYQVFNSNLESEIGADNLIITKESFISYQTKKCIVCGDAAAKTKALMQNEAFEYFESNASAKNMVILSHEAFLKGEFENLAYFRPFYLKPPNITKSKKPLF